MDIGKKIQSLRLQYGLTQKELADRAELSKGFISQLERNQTSPSIATLTDILECLGTTPGEFFSDRGEEKIVFSSDDMFEKVEDASAQEPVKEQAADVRYRCTICGYIYEGDIAKESDDYKCPICTVPKDMFEKV